MTNYLFYCVLYHNYVFLNYATKLKDGFLTIEKINVKWQFCIVLIQAKKMYSAGETHEDPLNNLSSTVEHFELWARINYKLLNAVYIKVTKVTTINYALVATKCKWANIKNCFDNNLVIQSHGLNHISSLQNLGCE